jgi:hypothetical protein
VNYSPLTAGTTEDTMIPLAAAAGTAPATGGTRLHPGGWCTPLVATCESLLTLRDFAGTTAIAAETVAEDLASGSLAKAIPLYA